MTDRNDDGQAADRDIEAVDNEGLPAAERRRARARRADVVGAVVVEVPNAAWVGPVADAWGRAVSSGDPEEHNGDGISRPSSWRPSSDST